MVVVFVLLDDHGGLEGHLPDDTSIASNCSARRTPEHPDLVARLNLIKKLQRLISMRFGFGGLAYRWQNSSLTMMPTCIANAVRD